MLPVGIATAVLTFSKRKAKPKMSTIMFYERRGDGGADETKVKCDNCDWTGVACDLESISDYQERVTPGETTPAGECPDCGCLAYVVTP
jgi:hypothetical protein